MSQFRKTLFAAAVILLAAGSALLAIGRFEKLSIEKVFASTPRAKLLKFHFDLERRADSKGSMGGVLVLLAAGFFVLVYRFDDQPDVE